MILIHFLFGGALCVILYLICAGDISLLPGIGLAGIWITAWVMAATPSENKMEGEP